MTLHPDRSRAALGRTTSLAEWHLACHVQWAMIAVAERRDGYHDFARVSAGYARRSLDDYLTYRGPVVL